MQPINNLLPDLLNKVQVQRESTEPKIGDDFEIALNNPKILNTPFERIKEVLRLVMVKIGLRANNWPADEEKAVLLRHILHEYAGHTPEEVLLAFDMAIAGKLDVEVNCYENFSCLYFSNIMNAYREWAKEQHKEIKPVMIEAPKETLTDKSMEDWIEQLKTEKRVDFLPVMVYDWLDTKGKIVATNRIKWNAMEKARKHFQGKDEPVTMQQIKDTAKRFLLMDYISSL
jgi:hypothetical protein